MLYNKYINKITFPARGLLLCLLISSGLAESANSSQIVTGSRYITGEDGIIRIFVNIWGEVESPGRIMIDEGVDLPTAMSIAGGPKSAANLKKIKVYRDAPDNNGISAYTIDIQDYIKSGDKKDFIEIRPNDTIVVPKKASAVVLEQVGALTAIMTMINLYLTLAPDVAGD